MRKVRIAEADDDDDDDSDRVGKGPVELQPLTIIEGEIKSEEAVLTVPCHLCGSDDHGTVCRTMDLGTIQGVEYICPVISYDCWNRQIYSPGLGLRICPRRFALVYQYNRYAVVDAFFKFENRGLGRFMTPMDLMTFRESIFALCHSDEACICKEWRI